METRTGSLVSRRSVAKALAKCGFAHSTFASSKPLEYLTFGHSRGDFRTGFLSGLMLPFCSSLPHRPRSAERLGAPPDTTRVALRRGHPCIATVQRNPAPPASGSIPFSPVPSNTRRGNRPIGSGPPGPPAAASLSLPSPSRSGAPSGCRVWFIARRAVAGRRSNSRAGAAIDILAPAPLISATSLAAGRRAGGGTAARLIDGNCGRSPRSAIDRYERGTTLGLAGGSGADQAARRGR